MRKLVVITGGTRGIGRAIVEKFTREGYEVAVCARSLPALKALQAKLSKDRVHIFSADLSVRKEVSAFGNFVLELNLPVSALINNAGVFLPGRMMEEDEQNLSTQLNTNLLSAYFLTRHLVSRITAGSHIFNMCSIASRISPPNSGSYAISKFALLGFTQGLRAELRSSGVKVTAVLPGATFTDSWAGTALPESRFIPAVDVAEAVWSAYRLTGVVEEIVIRPQLGDL